MYIYEVSFIKGLLMHSQHPLIRRPIIRTFANSNGCLIPFLLFHFKIHPIIRTFAISNQFFGPVGVRINGWLLYKLDDVRGCVN